jgi:hypothetical protein
MNEKMELADTLEAFQRIQGRAVYTICSNMIDRLTTRAPPTQEPVTTKSIPGALELAGIIHDAADGGTSEEYCSWTMANRAAEAVHARLVKVKHDE